MSSSLVGDNDRGNEMSSTGGGAQSVPTIYSYRIGGGGRRSSSLFRTSSSLILNRDQTREMCCYYGNRRGSSGSLDSVSSNCCCNFHHHNAPFLIRLLYFIPLSTGILLAFMSPINSSLKILLDSGTYPVLLSYSISFLISILNSIISHYINEPARLRFGILKKFIKRKPFNFMVLFGGILGLLPVLADTYAPEKIGVGMLSVGVVFGQTFISVISDRFGLFWRKPYHLPWPIWTGFIIVFIGAIIYRIDSIVEFSTSSSSITPTGSSSITPTGSSSSNDRNLTIQLLFTGLAVLSGIARTTQTALNRKLAPLLGRHRDALSFNYLIGTLIMIIVAPSLSPKPKFQNTKKSDIWKFLSGILSLTSQTLAILSNKLMGMTKSVAWQIASQICCGMILDHMGLLGLTTRPLSAYNVIGVTVVLIGVLMTDMDIPHVIDDEDQTS